MKLAALILVLAFGPVWADGVPLITPGPAIQASPVLTELAKRPEFVKLHPIALNKGAFGANVLTVVIEGTEYRFVGAVVPKKEAPKGMTPPRVQSWVGREPGGAVLIITKNESGGAVSGGIEMPPARRFEITSPRGVAVLVETDRNAPSRLGYYTPPPFPASGVQR
jgi:hypothetical protein